MLAPKKKTHIVFFCLRDWGGGPGTGLQSLREEGGEGLLSRPTSPAPIMQAEKNKVFFSFFGASLLNAQRSPDFGQRKRIIAVVLKKWYVDHY